MSRILLPVLLLLVSCQYVKDRTLDFLDPYRLTVGAGTVGGVRLRSLGLYDTGLMFGVKPNAAALGWKYGWPLFFNSRDARIDVDQAEIIKTTSIVSLDYSDGSYFSARNSVALLPAIFTWTDSTPTEIGWNVPEEGNDFEDSHWLWSGETFRNNRWAQIHAFDIELEAAILVYFDSGFSPGEVIDFFLGLVFIDIAADDGRW